MRWDMEESMRRLKNQREDGKVTIDELLQELEETGFVKFKPAETLAERLSGPFGPRIDKNKR